MKQLWDCDYYEYWILVITIALVIISVLLLDLFIQHNHPCSCNIGKNEVAGDYITSGYCGILNSPYADCAIKDCSAYNKVNNETRCVV